VNRMRRLTSQVRNIAEVSTDVARGDLSKKITVDAKGEILSVKDTINTMVDQLNSFAGEVTASRARWAPKGSSAGQADVKGVSGVWKDLDRQRELHGKNLTTQVRGIVKVGDGGGQRRSGQALLGERQGRDSPRWARRSNMTKTLSIFAQQATKAWRGPWAWKGSWAPPGRGTRSGGHLEEPDRPTSTLLANNLTGRCATSPT